VDGIKVDRIEMDETDTDNMVENEVGKIEGGEDGGSGECGGL
jgi:hypothetical protein